MRATELLKILEGIEHEEYVVALMMLEKGCSEEYARKMFKLYMEEDIAGVFDINHIWINEEEGIFIDKTKYTKELYDYDFAANGVFVEFETDNFMLVVDQYDVDILEELNPFLKERDEKNENMQRM